MHAAAVYAARQLVMRLAFKVGRVAAFVLIGALVWLSGCTVFEGGGLVVMQNHVIAGMPGLPGRGPIAGPVSPGNPIVPVPISPGHVTDAQRYQLALAAGWRGDDAIMAVAISLAEDPSGDPTVISPTDDVGLWQINRVWWATFGGAEALKDPNSNAAAAFTIWSTARTVDGVLQRWNSWSTFRQGTYLGYMARARASAEVVTVPNTAYVFPLPNWQGAINLHWGVAPGGSDLFAPVGQPVVSMGAGVVQSAGFERIGGNNVLVKGSEGLLYYYAHFMSAPLVSARQPVLPGTPLGFVGNTGDAVNTPSHLHLGIGYWINLGADAYGGTGGGFDAVSFLRQVYSQERR